MFKIELTCQECDIRFERYIKHKSKRNFCSKKCWYSWRSRNERGEIHYSYKSQKIQCDQCGKPLIRRPCEMKEGKKYFCDNKCRGQWMSIHQTGEKAVHWQGGNTPRECSFCQKIVECPANRIERSEHIFCDTKCASSWRSLNIKGETHPLWQGGWIQYRGPNWNQQRTKVRKRDGYKCQRCGITQKKLGKELDVHHIVPFREFDYIPNKNENYKQANQLTNLITLCPTCHKKAEFGKIAIPLPLF